MIEETATEFTLKQLETFGAFSLVIVAAGAVIWWLVRELARQRAAFTKVIDDKEAQIKEERDYGRTVASNAFNMINKLETAIALLSERLRG